MTTNKTPNVEAANQEARVRLAASLQGKGAHLSFEEAVHDFPDRLMNEKPAHVPYSFWHSLEHIRLTQWDMLEYIRDPAYQSPPWPAGYWPDQDAATDRAGWQRTVERYLADRQEFVSLVQDPETDLLAPVAHMENRSILRAALIIVDHTAYHLGEFIMGRQILGAWNSALA